MNTGTRPLENKKHIFQLEVLIEQPSQALALAALLQALHHPHIADFRILQGLSFGQTIAHTLQHEQGQPIPLSSAQAAASPSTASASTSGWDNLLELQQNGTLIRLSVVKQKGVRLSIPCRILQINAEQQLLTVYHVDEKKVYTFHWNEVEDVVPSG